MALPKTRLRLLLNDGFGVPKEREFILRSLDKISKRPVSSLTLKERTVVIELFKEFLPVIINDIVIFNKFRNFGRKKLNNIKEQT